MANGSDSHIETTFYVYEFGGLRFEVWPSSDEAGCWTWSCDELDEEESAFESHRAARRAAEKRALAEAGVNSGEAGLDE